jgi:hypothetical protein
MKLLNQSVYHLELFSRGLLISSKKSNEIITLFLLIASSVICLNNYYFIAIYVGILIYSFCEYKIKTTIKLFCIAIIPIFIYILIKNKNVLTYIPDFTIINILKHFIDVHYQQKTASFIELILFNIKTNDSYHLYNDMKELSLVYLITVSGFQLSFVKIILNKIIKKKNINFYLTLCVITFYTILLK